VLSERIGFQHWQNISFIPQLEMAWASTFAAQPARS